MLKKDSQLKQLFALLGSAGIKAVHKLHDEIDPCNIFWGVPKRQSYIHRGRLLTIPNRTLLIKPFRHINKTNPQRQTSRQSSRERDKETTF